MRILVTGGAGFIGSHLVDALLARGDQVRVFDALTRPVHCGERPSYLAPAAELFRGSVTDKAAFREALVGVDAVFHVAAYQDYHADFSSFFLINSVGTAMLYEIVVEDRLPIRKIVVASSQAVYGEGAYRCPAHGQVHPGQRPPERLAARDWEPRCPACDGPIQPEWTTEAVVAPHNSYALSKRDQEDVALKLGRRYGIPSVALRFSIVLGPRQSFRNAYSGALRSFVVRALAGQPPVLFEDGWQLRDFVSVHDVVRANLLVFDDRRADFEAFNVGGARRVTVRELASMVGEATGRSADPQLPGLYRVGDARHIFSDVSKLAALGWAPVVPLAAVVDEYVAWATEQPDVRDTFTGAQAHMRASGVLLEAAAWGNGRRSQPNP